MSGLRYLLFWMLLTMPVAAMAAPVVQPAVMPLGGGPDRMADGAARMVGAILEFSRWPARRTAVHLCLTGAAQHADKLGDIGLSDGTGISVLDLPDDGSMPPGRCDALYFGRMDGAAQRRLIAGAHGQAVVTIAEADPDCQSGAMFCLIFAPQMLSFQLNVDAVSRSAVRIDPRVLRMSKGGY